MPKRPAVVGLVIDYFKNLGCKVSVQQKQTRECMTRMYTEKLTTLMAYDKDGRPIIRINCRPMLSPNTRSYEAMFTELYFGDDWFLFSHSCPVQSIKPVVNSGFLGDIEDIETGLYLYLFRAAIKNIALSRRAFVSILNYIFMNYDENSANDIKMLMNNGSYIMPYDEWTISDAAKYLITIYSDNIKKSSACSGIYTEALAVLMELNNKLHFIDDDEAANYIL